jgi:23S rRNA (cytosine1962-C5)-methyltransferase
MSEHSSGQLVVTISRRGAERIRAGHVWVYRSDVVEATDVSPGSVVLVQEPPGVGSAKQADMRALASPGLNTAVAPKGGRRRPPHTRLLGTAFYSTASEIAIRMISSKPVTDIDQLVRERIRAAIAYRQKFVRDTNAYRVIFSEGDFLPGLIVDRYNDIVSVQVLTQAMDVGAMRETFLSELKVALQPRAIVERVDARVRKLEQLEEKESGSLWTSSDPAAIPNRFSGEEPAVPEREADSSALKGFGMTADSKLNVAENGSPVPTHVESVFHMNGVRFLFDSVGGQKTGAFLDQRENYAAAAQYARGEALDVFCYQGGFALHLAQKCSKVTGVDSSRPALEMAEQNAALNGREIEWIEANAFDLLRDYSDTGKKYDCIVLDPPAFAKSRRDLPTALRGYKELNLRVLKMLRPGGILISCSCSYHVSASDLRESISSAALDSHRIIRVLENRSQAKDHPSVLGIPETAYLKCLVLYVS